MIDTVVALRWELLKAHTTDDDCKPNSNCATCSIIDDGDRQAMIDRLRQYPCVCGHVWAYHAATRKGVYCWKTYPGHFCGCTEYRPAFEQEEAKI